MKELKIKERLIRGFMTIIGIVILVTIIGSIGFIRTYTKALTYKVFTNVLENTQNTLISGNSYMLTGNESYINEFDDAIKELSILTDNLRARFTKQEQIDELNTFCAHLEACNDNFKQIVAQKKIRTEATNEISKLSNELTAIESNMRKDNRTQNSAISNQLQIMLLQNQYICNNDKSLLDTYQNAYKENMTLISQFGSNNDLMAELLHIATTSDIEFSKYVNATAKVNALVDPFKKEADAVITNARERRDMQIQMISSLIKNSIIGMALLLILAIILSIAVTKNLIHSIVHPVERCAAFAEKIAKGDLTAEITEKHNDEIGMMTKALRAMTVKFSNIIVKIQEGANVISMASQEISDSSHAMSEGASEQAASLEQISSSMEEMVANIKQNADNSMETEKIALNATSSMVENKSTTEKAQESMAMIAKKIGIINEIASQTNILALNAAVEAARAGDVGKGFAVVATEVRKLAERCAEAADEISIMSTNGVDVTNKASENFISLIPLIEKTSNLVQEITAASKEQDIGANQINESIQQLNTIAQTNASSSEELAASAEKLNAQANDMKKLIGYFKINLNHKQELGQDANMPDNLSEYNEQHSLRKHMINFHRLRHGEKAEQKQQREPEGKKGFNFNFESNESMDSQFQKF